ncbi:MAG: MarR family transcriptional regulator [Paracoccaceae bacterium]|nr:MarR family transcriptional regulator [Paracoccaceae bacterium]
MTDYRLHNRLGYRISRLSRLMQARLEAGIAEQGLTRLMWCVLTGIGDEDVTAPSDLAAYVGVTRPAMSRLLTTLERKGYVARGPGHSQDGRAVNLALTEAGHQAKRAARVHVDAQNSYFQAKLLPGENAALMAALATLAAGEEDDLTNF